jgi:alkanesulfonate monooxygenase SsuD/methylene tetrahydromethanopterin reductase-like flavin-dependent oxidoreductase (luciferase family)
MLRVGLTLPSFRDDPDRALAVAAVAEEAGLDGVFVFDHVFRAGPSGVRPALECFTLLGAVAASTSRILVGTLVARATLRPPATLAHALETVHRVSAGRLVAGIGVGDAESAEENESFGLPFGTLDDRVAALVAALDAARGRGFPVWVAGAHPRVRALAAHADGWNRWGASPSLFSVEARDVRAVAPDVELTWAGLVVVADDDEAARAKADRLGAPPTAVVGGPESVAATLREYGAAGASWVVLGPVDSADPDNARLLGERVRPLLGDEAS